MAVENEHLILYYNIKMHEKDYNSIVSFAEQMLSNNRPDVKCIRRIIDDLNFENLMFVEMFNSLVVHEKNAAEYHNFYKKSFQYHEWLEESKQKLNTVFNAQNITFEEGHQLNNEMLTLKDEIDLFKEKLNNLELKCKSILPLKLQTSSEVVGKKITSNISITGQKLKLNKGEKLTLLNNSDPFNWKVQTSDNKIYNAPNLYFSFQPPDKESFNFVKKLQILYTEVINLWSLRHHEVSQNTLLDVINNLKTWDYSTYCTKNPFLRNVVFNALENDINLVLSENKFDNIKSLQLFKEFEKLKVLFTEFDNSQKEVCISVQKFKIKTNGVWLLIKKNNLHVFKNQLIKQAKLINKTKNTKNNSKNKKTLQKRT